MGVIYCSLHLSSCELAQRSGNRYIGHGKRIFQKSKNTAQKRTQTVSHTVLGFNEKKEMDYRLEVYKQKRKTLGELFMTMALVGYLAI